MPKIGKLIAKAIKARIKYDRARTELRQALNNKNGWPNKESRKA